MFRQVGEAELTRFASWRQFLAAKYRIPRPPTASEARRIPNAGSLVTGRARRHRHDIRNSPLLYLPMPGGT
jgi:hypothetical protein